MTLTILRPIRLFAPIVAAAMLAACGGSEPEPAGQTPTAGPAPAAAPAVSGPGDSTAAAGPAVHDGRPIEITGDDTIRFNLTEIRAKAGERLSVTFVNTGTMPKFSMGHNWVLLAGGVDPEAFASDAAQAATTDYLPAARGGDIIAATKLLGPNERDTVTFDAPSAPGRYDYLCSFPGHFQVGMRGVLIVE
ncbi:MAG: plastocyanin/azurin family copper-binding protein [Acidobacteriota bacterium]|jgi:azurin|nr:MAG: azurin [Acidobacteriota bacterium]